MARINIEDIWWSDARRSKLIELLKGNSRLADGLMLQAWKLAQNHCTNENGYIPLLQFLCLSDAELLFECDLAVLVVDGTKQTPSKTKQTIASAQQNEAIASKCQAYVRGTEQHHSWLIKRRQAASNGGVKSAKRQRNKGGKLQANTKQNQANASKDQQTQPSSSSSSSCSYSFSGEGTETQKVWQHYAEKILAKYGQAPIRNAKINSVITQLVKRVPSEDLRDLIDFYFRSENPFYEQRMFSLEYLLKDAESLHLKMKSGMKGAYANGYALPPRTQNNLNVVNNYIASLQDDHEVGNEK